MEFTALERAVLNWMCEARNDRVLRALVGSAMVTSRDNTGHGFFTHFEVDRSLGRVSGPPEHPRIVNGPIAQMHELGDSAQMAFIMFADDGMPDCLEGFQLGDKLGDTVDLRERELSSLTFEWLELLP